MQLNKETLDPRRSGQVTRYHTWPRRREQTVAEHSWQCVRILLAIWPEVPRHLIIYMQQHDIGEVGAGDMPFPAKRFSPELKALIDKVESHTHLAMVIPWGVVAEKTLQPEEQVVVKLADIMEMWEWALDELIMGNNYAKLVKSNCEDVIKELLPKVEDGVRNRAIAYRARRIATFDKISSINYPTGEENHG